MKKLLFTALIIVASAITANCQTAFLDRLPTTETGIMAEITYDGAFLKIEGHDDLSKKLSLHTRFVLLNTESIKDKVGLPTLKIRILTDDEDDSNYSDEGTVGYIYPSLTALSKYFNYKEKIVAYDGKKHILIKGGEGSKNEKKEDEDGYERN